MADFTENKTGCLVLVATPIGNDLDFPPRAVLALQTADRVAAEDTRIAARLFATHDIHTPLVSYFEHNARQREEELMAGLQAGETVALISDAGMPCISDPGQTLVERCVAAGIPVRVIPGPNAALTVLSASGLTTDRFVFEGFLPVRGQARRQRLAEISQEKRTILLYEAPHRLQRTLQDLSDSGLKTRRLVLGRELTKRYEEFLYGTVAELAATYDQRLPKGEFSLALEGLADWQRRQAPDDAEEAQRQADAGRQLLRLQATGLTLKDAVREVSQTSGLSRNQVYQLALALQKETDE